MDVLALGKLVAGELGKNAEGVGTKVVTLSLEEVSGEQLATVTVEEGESGGECGGGDTPEDGLSDHATPALLSVVDGLVEEVVEEKILELGVLAESSGDVLEEDGSDNATTTPHESDRGVVELPVVLLGSLAHEHEALGVRDNLGGVESLLEVSNELFLVALEGLDLRATENLGGTGSLALERREATGKDGLTDKGDGLTKIESVDGGPLAGTLLSSRVEDLGEEGGSILVVVLENVTGNLDQERVENTSVPLREDVTDLGLLEAETVLEDVVGLADELHVTVLDTVVDHLDIVAGTGLADPVTAGLTVGLGSSLLEDLLDVGPGGIGTTGHERGTVTGTLFTTRDTGADKEETLGLELLGAADGVGIVRVTTVDDDIALLEVGHELLNESVNGGTGLDEEDHLTGALELGNKLLDGLGANDVGACVDSDQQSRSKTMQPIRKRGGWEEGLSEINFSSQLRRAFCTLRVRLSHPRAHPSQRTAPEARVRKPACESSNKLVTESVYPPLASLARKLSTLLVVRL